MSPRRQHPTTEREVCAAVHRALEHLGWLPPTTADAVAAAERRETPAEGQASDATRPPFEQVAAARPGTAGRWQMLPHAPSPSPVEATLARAARDGGRLSPEVEQAMRRDRDAAETRARTRQAETPDNEP